MSTLDIASVRFSQPVPCKCGRVLTRADICAGDDTLEIVCSACHASVLEIEIILPENEPWD
jgi:hypothetical protein